MRIDFAHVRVPAAAGGWIDYAVFDAKATAGGEAARNQLLFELTVGARRTLNLKIDQSALAYRESGHLKFWGDEHLVEHLAKNGLPQRWTHYLDV